MDKHREKRENNRKLWDEITSVHFKHPEYGVEKFLNGENDLDKVILDEIGDVMAKRLLHLQCHFGLDTLRFARMGAEATGIDYSEEAIKHARQLADLSKTKAKFIISDIYDCQSKCNEKFDIVFASFGVICWLNDLNKWAEIIADFLQPGGYFYFVEGHPTSNIFNEEFQPVYKYFHEEEPEEWPPENDYCDWTYTPVNSSFEWNWTIGDVVTALCKAGLRLEFLHEFPFGAYKHFANMEKRENKQWWIPGKEYIIPLNFSLKAMKD
ncbi:MAG: class I SAM-dependent methyltransferase [candidate division Zixibacteria bacterium]|nr:class I SAM-dependent methyltransferase [candidate division Zixibacteria bacterium]